MGRKALKEVTCMKNNLFSVVLLALAIVIAIGSLTVLGPCVHEDGSEAPCSNSGRAILMDGCLLAALALIIILVHVKRIRIVLFVLALCASVMGVMLPGTLLPLCRMDTMHCRSVMQPAMIILFVISIIASVAGIVIECIRTKGRKV